MSGASENKWRRGAPNSTNSGQQQRQSSSSLRGGEAAGQKNAWGQNKARGTGSGPQSPRTGPTPGGTAAIPQPAPQLKDAVSTTDPIATEIKAYFNGRYREALTTAGVDEKTATHKPSVESGATKPAWGARANIMGNGKDFFVELAKQVKALEEAEKKSK